ncbi:MAG: SPOR domain-containing protein [Deltaproteobacteria bacterium]|nr:SPOR domain-containing protein [Deltaproteobacteria bacterium]
MAKRTKRKPRSKEKPKKYLLEMTSLSVSLWGVALFFLLAWIFVLGILVGRGFLPGAVTAVSDLKGQITRLQEMISHDRVKDLGVQKKSDSNTKLAFYEKLSRKKDEAKREWPLKNNSEGSKIETTPTQFNVSQGASPEKRAEGIKKEKTQMKVAASQEALPERRKRTDGTQYTVQLASLGDRDKAEKMINRLVAGGHPAYFYEVKVKGKTHYRVRCGRFIKRGEAEAYAMKLAKEAGIKGFVSRIE